MTTVNEHDNTQRPPDEWDLTWSKDEAPEATVEPEGAEPPVPRGDGVPEDEAASAPPTSRDGVPVSPDPDPLLAPPMQPAPVEGHREANLLNPARQSPHFPNEAQEPLVPAGEPPESATAAFEAPLPPSTPSPPTDRALPESRALIPPTRRPGDVYRGDDYSALGDPDASRPSRAYPATAIENRAEPQRTKPSKWSTIVLPFIAGIVGAGLVVGGFFLFRDDDSSSDAASAANAETVTIRETVRTEFIGPDGSAADPTAVARKVIPSVVTVQVGDANGNGTGSGSGVVLSSDGYIVTNEHVVEGAEVVEVSFSDGRLYDAELLGADALTDLAVLKIDADGLVPIDIGSTETLQIGDPAIAAGSPLGLSGGPTVTVGVISAFDREVQTGPAAVDRLLGMLQTDAPITRGSSGGALVDAEGALIGITSAVGVSDVGVEGIGFAIPIEVVERITAELIETGAVEHSFLGIEGRTSFEEQFDGAELAVGVFIQAVVDDTGAAVAGLTEGDVITAIEGAEVRTINSLVGQLRRYPVGEPLDVEVLRGETSITLTIELGPRPDDA